RWLQSELRLGKPGSAQWLESELRLGKPGSARCLKSELRLGKRAPNCEVRGPTGTAGELQAPVIWTDTTKVPHTLLLADDSVTIQRVIELTFADEDVQVIAVSDGDQAIARLDANPPDIVLADIGMPGRNGYEVAQYMHESPKLAHIPVVLLTGAFEPVDQERAAAAGCDGVLAKPFEPQLVIGRVKELLVRHRVPPSLDNDIAAPLTAPA